MTYAAGIYGTGTWGAGNYAAGDWFDLIVYVAIKLPGVPSSRRVAIASAASAAAFNQGYTAQSVIDTLALCRNWFAFEIASCFQDSEGSTPCTTTGQPIGRVVPWVGSTPATQATTANKPTTSSSGASFATDDWLDAGSSINPVGNTYTIVTNAIATSGTGAICGRDFLGSRGFVFFRTTTGGNFETGGTAGTSYTAANNLLISVTGGIQIHVDGNLAASATRSLPANTNTFSIGRRNYAGVENYLNGSIRDLIVKDDAAYSASDRAKVERFLKLLRA